MKIRGDAALIRQLNDLGKAGRAVKRRGLSRAGKALYQVMRKEVPVATGATKRRIGQTRRKDDTVAVGVRSGADKKTGKIPEQYAHIIERRTGWFGRVWSAEKPGVAKRIQKEIMAAIRDRIAKTRRR